MFSSYVAQILTKETGLPKEEVAQLIEIPPDSSLGDYAFPCFSLAKEAKKAPASVAEELAKKLTPSTPVAKISSAGPYVNFFIEPNAWAAQFAQEKLFEKIKGKKVLIEFPSPNTNKPLHLGHVRNMTLGSALSCILETRGCEVVRVNLNNDRGIHICKSMLAYQLWGGGKEPDKKPDHFVGDFYVRFAQEAEHDESLQEQAQELLRKWEAGDESVRALWSRMNEWAHTGFAETYERYNISFDKEYFESEFFAEGKKLIEQNKELFAEEDGAIVARLEKYGLPDKVLLRSDGTSIYITQDIVLTRRKMRDFSPDKQIWVVGNEQELHFKQLFAILDMLGIPQDTFFHLSYGMIELPDGKMKSREGRVVDADDLLDEMESLAATQVAERHPDWSADRVKEVSSWLAMGAIRFFILKYDAAKNFVFDPENSLSFEGDTGPYVQYTHARLSSIIRKAGSTPKGDLSVLGVEEIESVKALYGLRKAFESAATSYRPHLIAQQLLLAARALNTYYHAHQVLQAENDVRDARLVFLELARKALAEGLSLLGIHAPEEM